MRIGGAMYVPMTRPVPVRAGGGNTAAAATPTAPVPAPATPAPATTTPPATGFQALAVKVEGFFSNIWDTLIGPFLQNLMGMFGL